MSLHHDDAARLFDALALFPSLSTEERARIANAAESQHPAAWADAKKIRLDRSTFMRAFTLNEACHWASNPTAGQIITGLNYAAGIVAAPETKENA